MTVASALTRTFLRMPSGRWIWEERASCFAGITAAVVYSLVSSCKAMGVDLDGGAVSEGVLSLMVHGSRFKIWTKS